MRNLCAEMARFGVSPLDIGRVLNCSERTVKNKMDGKTEFAVREAFKVRDSFFPGLRIEYLFADDHNEHASGEE